MVGRRVGGGGLVFIQNFHTFSSIGSLLVDTALHLHVHVVLHTQCVDCAVSAAKYGGLQNRKRLPFY